jgi:hypothetical protein
MRTAAEAFGRIQGSFIGGDRSAGPPAITPFGKMYGGEPKRVGLTA